MNLETLKIFVGFDEKESVVFHTCVQSIIEKCKVPVSIHPLNLQMFLRGSAVAVGAARALKIL